MFDKKRNAFLLAIATSALFVTGCTPLHAPTYNASRENVLELKKADISPVKVGDFSVGKEPKTLHEIGLRFESMVAGPNITFGDYLKKALELELILAKKYDPNAKIEISGTLLDQDLETGNGTGFMKVTFRVTNGGKPVYDKTLSTQIGWETSFLGEKAIRGAQRQYPVLVQSIITKLFEDPEFIKALGGK